MVDQSRVPPHDPAAEQAVLGGILIDNTALDRVNLKPEDFYDRRHSLVFRAMQRMIAGGTSIDVVTLHDALKEEPERPPNSYLAELVDATPSAANIGDHAGIVRDKADRRSLITLTEDIYQRAHTGEAVASLRERLLHRAASLVDPFQDADSFKSMSWKELKQAPQEQAAWVVDGLLQRNGLSLLLSDPKVGKSVLARTLAWAVALGERWLGRDVEKGRVLYLALEEMPADIRRHFLKMNLPDDADIHMVFERHPKDPLKWFEQLVAEVQPDLVVLDTLVQLVSFREINDYSKTSQDLRPLLDVTRRSNAHVLVLHHMRKRGGIYGHETLGSQAIYATVDMKLTLTREGQQRSITSDGREHRKIEEPLALHLDEETGLITVAGTKKELDTQTKTDEVFALLKKEDAPMTIKALQAVIGGRAERLLDALTTLRGQGKIERKKDGRAYVYYCSSNENCSRTLPEGREQFKVNYSNGLGPKSRTLPVLL